MMSMGSCNEMQVLLDMAKDLEYMDAQRHKDLKEKYEELGRMLNGLHKNWK